jgi:hypothetical protein
LRILPVDPRLTCCLVHTTAAIDEKGNEGTIVALEAIATQLRKSLFTVLGYTIDGNSCFNCLHDGFQDAWEGKLSSGPLNSFFETQMLIPVVVSDPLHLLKRIQYRLLSSDFRIGVNEDLRTGALFVEFPCFPIVTCYSLILLFWHSLCVQMLPNCYINSFLVMRVVLLIFNVVAYVLYIISVVFYSLSHFSVTTSNKFTGAVSIIRDFSLALILIIFIVRLKMGLH